MPDYDDLIADLNTLESDWGGHDAMPPVLSADLDRARGKVDQAQTGVDPDGLTGAINYLKLLQQNSAAVENRPPSWDSDLQTVLDVFEAAND